MQHPESNQQPQPDTEAEPQPRVGPRIYVASLSDYNAGRLHGTWIDADQEPEDIHVAIRTMLSRSRELVAEEWAIYDYEGFGSLRLSESESIDRVARIAAGITEHGSAFSAWAGYVGTDDPELVDRFSDAYLGTYPSPEAYAEQVAEDLGLADDLVPEWARPYLRIDYAALARDLEIEMIIETDRGGGVHVFDPHV